MVSVLVLYGPEDRKIEESVLYRRNARLYDIALKEARIGETITVRGKREGIAQWGNY